MSQCVKKTPPHAHTRSLNGHFRTVGNYWKSVTQVPGKSPQTTSVMTGTEPNIPFAAINDVSGCCASYYYQSFVKHSALVRRAEQESVHRSPLIIADRIGEG